MKQRIVRLVQRLVLHVSYWCASVGRRPRVDWVIGPFEVAGVARDLRDLLPRSETALLRCHAMYDSADYDWLPPARESRFAFVNRWRHDLRRPYLLARSAARARGIIYLSDEGYLPARIDGREYEYRFLAARGKRIVCYFTGSDIRSPQLMQELEEELGEPNIGTRLRENDPSFGTPENEERRRRVGEAASTYADLIVTAPADQRGHLSVETEPFRYLFPAAGVLDDFDKFRGNGPTVIVHAPSSPLIKGTPLVRDAVETLRAEGHDIEYIELQGVSNTVVREQLRRAHIALNQFYAYVPSVFGIEAMASCCAVMMRADPAVESILPADSADAWLITRHDEVTENLRRLLDDRRLAERYARAGREWVLAHGTAEVNGPALRASLDRVLAGGPRPRPSAE